MTKFILAAGVAALAISAPAVSKFGGNGGGHGHAAGGQQHAQRQNGGGHGGGGQQHAQRQNGGGHGGQQHAQRQNGGGHGNARVAARAQQHGHGGHANVRVAARAQGQQHGNQHNQQVRQAQARQHNQQARQRNQQVRQAEARQINRNRGDREQAFRQAQNDRQRAFRNFREQQNQRNFARNSGFGAGGCPPGLARKAMACMPPGQARKLLGARVQEARQIAAFNELPQRLRYVYRDTPDYYYRYGDGYVYRVNRTNDVISSLLPLFGAGYGVGQVFPQTYSTYGLPAAYQPFYPTTPGYDYRYANGYVYQVDPYTGMIANVDPMLGYGYGYGQMMPAAYSAYNVPYQYRPMYYDTSDAYYRYAPGAIYQVDPQTSLITGVAALLSNGMTVGQPMPLGYGAYNVPYDYRAQYYDSPDNWYRYANGNIYRVDPATQLVTALVASILT